MIDWLSVLFNSIWIIGAAIALAVISMACFQAQSRGVKLKKILNLSGFAVPLSISGGLFCLGLALTSDQWWEIALWILLVLGFGYQVYSIGKLSKK